MKIKLLAITIAAVFTLGVQADYLGADHNWNNGSSAAKKSGKPVGITSGVMEIAGISRNQDNKATIDPDFAKTSRKMSAVLYSANSSVCTCCSRDDFWIRHA